MDSPAPRRPGRFAVSLRSTMVAVLVAGFLLGGITRWRSSTRAQREALDELRWRGAEVYYSWMVANLDAGQPPMGAPGSRPWWATTLGEDAFFAPVRVDVSIRFEVPSNAERPGRAVELVGRFPTIERLSISGNRVHFADTRALANLTRVKHLEIHVYEANTSTLKANTPLDFLDRMPDLEVLLLSGVRLSVDDADLARLASKRRLRTLIIESTGTTDAGLAHLAGLGHLRTLIMSGARITDAGLAHLAGLTELQCISLPDADATNAGLAPLARAASLKSLCVGGRRVSDLSALRDLGGLTHLYLGDNRIDDAGARSLSAFPGLTHLNLSDAPIGDDGLAALSTLGSLRLLFLGGTRVTDAGLVHLRSLARLRCLNLERTRVTDAGLPALAPMKACKELQFAGLPFSTAAIAAFRAARGAADQPYIMGFESVGIPPGTIGWGGMGDSTGEADPGLP